MLSGLSTDAGPPDAAAWQGALLGGTPRNLVEKSTTDGAIAYVPAPLATTGNTVRLLAASDRTVPVVATRAVASALALRVGDATRLVLPGHQIDIRIAGIISAVPGTADPVALLVDLDTWSLAQLWTGADASTPTQVWAWPATGAADTTIASAVAAAVPTTISTSAPRATPLLDPALIAFRLATWTTVALAAGGVLAAARATARTRRREIGALRGLGVPGREQAALRVAEQARVLVPAVLGAGAGGLGLAALVARPLVDALDDSALTLPIALGLDAAALAAWLGGDRARPGAGGRGHRAGHRTPRAPGLTTRGVAMMRVLRRQMARDLSLLLIAVVTAGVVALTVGWPRALDRLIRDDLVAQTAALPTTQRDLTLTVPHFPPTPVLQPLPVDDGAQARLDYAARWTADQVADAGPALAAVLGAPQHEITRPPFMVDLGPHSSGISFMDLELSVGPREQDLRLVEGSWPAAPDVDGWLNAAAATTRTDIPALEMDVVLTPETARWMGWKVGEVRTSLVPFGNPFAMRLTGLVEASDPTSGVWAHLPGVLVPSVDRDDNAGWTVHGIGFVNPLAIGALMYRTGVSLTAWYPIVPAAVGEVDRQALAAELERIRASKGLRTEVSTVLAAAGGREHAASTLLAVLVAGLVGVAAGVLWLVSVLAVERRRAALVLLRRRGASSLRLAGLVGAQAAAAAIPGAVVGYLVGMRVPGRSGPGYLVLPGALTLGAVALMVLAGARVHGGRQRRVARFRWVGELVVLAATGFALTATSGSDPLLVALPLLVGLSAAIVALRVYPWPARLALRASGGRDLGSFLGLARAARLPAAGLVPALALTLGLATAGLGTTTVATVAAGHRDLARSGRWAPTSDSTSGGTPAAAG